MKKLLLFSLVLVLFACSNEKVYHQDIVSFRQIGYWPRFDHVQFDVPIEKTDFYYDIVMDITYDKNIDFDNIPIHVIMTTDDGEERIREYNFRIKDREGKHIGEAQPSGEYTYSSIIRQNFSMSEPNIIHIDIECFHPKFEIPFIKDVSVKLVKTASDNKKKKK